ncbi:MAG: type II secretion system F family protein [Chloroflexota bacterium]|nr:type II secretion system F family protein [Chloroflexota bacterium]
MNPGSTVAHVLATLGGLGVLLHARWEVVIGPDPWRLVWPTACAMGAGLLVGWGNRPMPLSERLRRLELNARVRETVDQPRERPRGRPLPGVLGVLLGPLLEDAGSVAEQLARRLAPGLIGGPELELEVRLAYAGRGLGWHIRRKLLGGLALGVVLPIVGALDGPQTPALVWPMLAAVGFLLPDFELRGRSSARRGRIVAALPPICDQLSIALAAGLSPEQALLAVANASVGELADELRWLLALMQGGAVSLVEALEELDARNQVAELSGLVSALRSAYQHGARAGMLVSAHADALRAAERARLVERGGQAMTRMVLPVGIFMLPVMAAVMIVPAIVQFAGLGN